LTAGAGEGTEVSSASCDFPGSQVWQARADGTIRNLEKESSCLTDAGNGVITTVACKGNPNQHWAYSLSGDLKNDGTGKCLTEGDEGVITTEACKYETNAQVFSLPIGVALQ
jgi:hypothetical protein